MTDEYTKLLQENSELSAKILRLEQERNELKQENKELKEKVKALDKMTGIFSARLCDKYKSALEEIRAYSENFCEKTCRFYANKDSMACNEYCLLDDIVTPVLEKINEVLGC